MDTQKTIASKFSNKMPVAYVIGGAGFIGSYVCESLRAQNVNVVAVDDFSSGKQTNLDKLKSDTGLMLLRADINSQLDPTLPKPDYIFHIGGIEAYVNGIDLTLNTMLVNSIGTYNTLEIAKNSKAKYLLVSSLDIYNGALSSLNLNKYFGLSERDTKRYTHHEAKRYAEALVIEYYKKFDIDARIVRIAETYGPRMDLSAGTELAQLIKDAIYTDSLTINGDGLKVLHPTFVSDITTGISKAMFSPNTQGKIYNLACQSEINLLNLAYIIQKNSTKPLKIQFTQEYKEIKFPMHKVELEQSQNDLGWQAKTKLEEGITQTLEFFFLNKDSLEKESEKRVQQKEEKSNAIPYTPPITPKSIQVDPAIQKTQVLKQNDKKTKTGKVNRANVLILGVSLFTILLMFIFPVTALYITSAWSLNSALNAAKELEVNPIQASKDISNSQRYIQFADSQFESLEWFYSMISKRDEYESSRGVLQAVDKLTRALSAKITSSVENEETLLKALNGKADSKAIEANTRKENDTILLLENSVLESQAIHKTIFFTKETNQISSLSKLTSEILQAQRENAIKQQLLQKIITPAHPRHFAIAFIDNAIYNQQGGNIYGFALIKTSQSGVIDFKVFEATKQNPTYTELIGQIKTTAEKQKYGNIEAVVLVNNEVESKLITTLKSINIDKYAEVITSQNLQEKISKEATTSEYKLAVWEGIWKSLTQAQNWKSLGQTIQDTIANEQTQLLMVQNGEIIIPTCGAENTLLKTTTGKSTPDLTKAYCTAPLITTTAPSNTIHWNVQTSAKTTSLEQNLVQTHAFENNGDKEIAIAVTATAPGSAKLTNVLAPFPISFDKIATVLTGATTSWTYELVIKPGQKAEVTYEWQANLSDGNIAESGLYIEKQYGVTSTAFSGQIEAESGKQSSQSSQNQDLYVPPTSI